MKIIISAGGTGGHIYPALSIINKIKEKEPNSQFIYIGTHNRMEKDIVPKQNIPYESIEIYGFNKRKLHKNFKTIACIFKSYKKCKKIINEFKPDVVIGVGGYVTVPVILAATKKGIPTFLHEQNTLPGKANIFLSKYVSKIGVSFKSSIESFPKYKAVFTGNPCSEDAKNIKPINKKELDLKENKKLVLVVMGSLGASTFNNYFINNINLFKNKDYEVIFITGKTDYDVISKEKFPSNIKVFPFIENLPKVMKKVDVLVTRAGASTLSELIELSVPSILIPSPFVANNHQYLNAVTLTDEDAAILLEEKDLKDDILIKKIDYLLIDKNIKKIKNNLKKLKIEDSSLKIYEEIKKLVGKK